MVSCILDSPFDDRPLAGTIDETRLDDLNLEVGRSFGYWYDFGDNWYHQINVVAIGEPTGKTRYPGVIALVGQSPPQYMDWDADAGEDDEGRRCDRRTRQPPGASGPMTNREKGFTPLDDVDKVSWTREDASKGEVLLFRDRTTTMTVRVRALQERPDGSGLITTYGVPGVWLSVWVAELQRRRDDEAETILSVEAV